MFVCISGYFFSKLVFVIFQTLVLLTAKLQTALWWTNYVISTLIRYLKGVSPGPTFLMFITCHKYQH